MNGRRARALRKEAQGRAAAFSLARGILPSELRTVTVVGIERTRHGGVHKVTNWIDVWIGRRRTYKSLKRLAQRRPAPWPAAWFVEAIEKGQLDPSPLPGHRPLAQKGPSRGPTQEGVAAPAAT